MKEERSRRYWLDEPKNQARVYYTLIGIALLLPFCELFFEKTGRYEFERWFGFYGAYGFVSCVALVLTAKELRKLLKRDEDYYE